ncbi:transposable element Tcb2 transposase [Trichonephila clavipes]|nr:transposable element Tcb2 transposase [Trichonephila clavipes]
MSFTRRSSSGHPQQTSRRDHHIVRNARVQPTASSAAIQAQVAPSLGTPVYSRAIRKRLAKGHLGSWRPKRVLPLTPTLRRLRLEWCRAREHWTTAEWNQQHTASTASVMVWGSIAYSTRSPVVLIGCIMTAQWYVHDILQPHVLPLMQRLPGAIFQQDNSRPHKARVSQDSLRTDTSLPFPSQSPDLSPIEHIWDHLGRRVGHFTSLNELEAKLQQNGTKYLKTSYRSCMPQCLNVTHRAFTLGVQQGIKYSVLLPFSLK